MTGTDSTVTGATHVRIAATTFVLGNLPAIYSGHMPNLFDIPVTTISGESTTLAPYKGHVLLIVNVASKCGLTPQYDALEKLYAQRKHDGLEILGFPANDFKEQEPGSNEEIAAFCKASFGVDFPMFQKIVVSGHDQRRLRDRPQQWKSAPRRHAHQLPHVPPPGGREAEP